MVAAVLVRPQDEVLCKPAASSEDAHPLPAYGCVKGLCDKCGWYETKEIKASAATLGAMSIELDGMVVSKAPEASGIEVGWRLTVVGGRAVTSKTAANSMLAAGAAMRFQTSVIRPELLFARCPLESSSTQQISYRQMQEQEQPRAHPSYSKDGEVTTTKKVHTSHDMT